MARKRLLTDEQRKENRENLDSCIITFRINKRLKEKIDAYSKQYTTRSKSIIDLIKTNPDFKNFKKI